MTTTIDNNQRVFILHGMGWNTQKYVCNMADISKCAAQYEKNQPYSISHIWNNKIQKLTIKQVIELLDANQLDSDFFKHPKEYNEALRNGYSDLESFRLAKYASHA